MSSIPINPPPFSWNSAASFSRQFTKEKVYSHFHRRFDGLQLSVDRGSWQQVVMLPPSTLTLSLPTSAPASSTTAEMDKGEVNLSLRLYAYMDVKCSWIFNSFMKDYVIVSQFLIYNVHDSYMILLPLDFQFMSVDDPFCECIVMD